MWLTTISDEPNQENNDAIDSTEVIGSIDPNDKLASPGGQRLSYGISPTQRISYLVQFENKPEATAEAIYVRVVDTLDPHLDWSTLAFGEMSHPDVCDYDFDPYTGVITWFCDGIMLPPNLNPPEGEGYFIYSISPKLDLPEGTEIANSAWIRFDYNEWLHAPEGGQPLVRTITYPCDCGQVGDINCDSGTDPLDVQYLVKFVFQSQDGRCEKPPCPYECGDVDCSGGVDPLDVQFLVKFVFQSLDALCDPCAL